MTFESRLHFDQDCKFCTIRLSKYTGAFVHRVCFGQNNGEKDQLVLKIKQSAHKKLHTDNVKGCSFIILAKQNSVTRILNFCYGWHILNK